MEFFGCRQFLIFLNLVYLVNCFSDPVVECYLNESSRINAKLVERANHYRKLHSVGPLTVDDSLVSDASLWSQHMAEGSEMECNRVRGDYDETIMSYTDFDAYDDSRMDIMKKWYIQITEMPKEDNDRETALQNAYFSEFLWEGSKTMGCGICTNVNTTFTFITCRFFPRIRPHGNASVVNSKENLSSTKKKFETVLNGSGNDSSKVNVDDILLTLKLCDAPPLPRSHEDTMQALFVVILAFTILTTLLIICALLFWLVAR